MIKREDMKAAVGIVAGMLDPEKGSAEWEEKARIAIARLVVEMIETQIECNRARAQYYTVVTRIHNDD